MEEQAPQRGPWKRNSSQELPDRRQRFPQAPRHFLKTVGSRKEKRLILGATPQTAKGQYQALLQGKDDIKFSPVALEDGLGLPDGQGTGNQCSSTEMQMALTAERMRLRNTMQPFSRCCGVSTALRGEYGRQGEYSRQGPFRHGGLQPMRAGGLKRDCGKGLGKGHRMFEDMPRVS
ncbi:PREDICTED: uncharacterized protein LOC107183486 [Myotis davidii]|uniref:uncharacterized protein LOC107183486 n=1 Tax=Myotis davidii TaxID=225400 RepID=UPI0007677EE2|nr:PREDICTED: uncharacterized protein LOC107183486 [Myotis davidii]